MDNAALSGAVVYVLTQVAVKVGDALKASLPPFVKQIIALVIAAGFNFSGLIPPIHISGDPQVNSALSTILTWYISMVAHDVAGAVAPKK